MNLRFAAADEVATPEDKGLFGLGLHKPDLMRLAETAMVGLIAILALLLVLRPLALRLVPPAIAGPADVQALEALTSSDAAAAGIAGAIAGPGGTPAIAGPANSGPAALLSDDAMVDLANVEGQIRASSLRRISDLVNKHPEETLGIVRGWIVQEGH